MNWKLFFVVLVATLALLVYCIMDDVLTNGQAAGAAVALIVITVLRIAVRRKALPAAAGH